MFKDLNDIRLFVEVVKQGAVTRGAEALGMPAATVSRRLAALEREVGERLIERNARRFHLTETGKSYLAAAARVIEDLEFASAEVSRVTGTPAGPLRLSAPPDFATFFLAEPIAAFCARYPAITVAMDLSPRRVDLIEEDFDVAIRMGRLQDSRLVSRPLTALPRSLYASHRHAELHPLPVVPADLDADRMVVLDAYLAQREIVLQRRSAPDEQRALAIDGHLRVNSIAMLRQLVIAGAGIALIPDALMHDEVLAGRAIRILPDWQASPIEAHLLYRGRALLPQRVRLMVEHLVAWFADGTS